MSVYSAKTSLSSILKTYSTEGRDKAKNAIINKVRFEMPKQKGLLELMKIACEDNNFQPLNEFIAYLKESAINDIEFFRIMNDACKVLHKFDSKFNGLVECLLAQSWIKRTPEAKQAYTEFFIDNMVAHSHYIGFGISKLIALWIPGDGDATLWPNGSPVEGLQKELEPIHKLLNRLLTTIPMTFDVVLHAVESMFPYFKKPPHVVAGYVLNVLWLMEYKPICAEFVQQLVLQKLVILDVNAPRNEIENTECDEDGDEDIDDMNDAEEQIFEMDDCAEESKDVAMNHPIAQTLDICMEKMFSFLDTQNPNELNITEEERMRRLARIATFQKVLLASFNNTILPCHNTHHVQFILFYYCSFKQSFAEAFLISLWDKIKNPNVSAVIRQAAVGYVASFLARSKLLSIKTLKHYLQEFCDWAHQYIQRGDQFRSNGSLKANLVFFSVCQAIFYVIAFRSRDLTVDKKSLMFLQSLQLSALVNCNLNPLRVCLPAVATAFAGVTRAYQLAYCHAILERNARRKLATVYSNDIATPFETLDTFFPFDPYLLKLSAPRIAVNYLQYQASEAEECNSTTSSHKLAANMRRKRGDSELIEDVDVDDFLLADKRQKFAELAKSQEREALFTYGLSPGFHT